jgi:two-component system CheB/CheR fusion protein
VKQPSPTPPFPIVGIGASAGGLEALEKFLAKVPVGSGLAFVVIQHLDPTVEDLLPELLQRITPMTVIQARDRMKIRPDCVHVIPPNKDMAVHGSTLRLSVPAAARGMRLPIDFFLRSLAEERGERSIGVILSGMGSDGLLGLRAIKEHGGLCLAQAPSGARFASMPRSVIDAGLADMVGEAEELPGKLMAFLQHTPRIAEASPVLELSDEPALERVILLLRARTGQEFSLYKRSTVVRRIERRMAVHQLATVSAYVRFLEKNPGELDLLFKELLIGVTNFFRDPAVWQALLDTALPAMFEGRPEGKVFRAWVPGCSTGEEAYGLAMLFREALDRVSPPLACSLQIFATDLDRDAITRARQGLFRANIAADVSEARLARFFTPEAGGFRVRQEIREMVVFAPQNLIMDPPFTRLDLLSCRNLLIYLAPELQRKLMQLFHYSLVPGGLLCLGSSESVGASAGQFTPLDAKSRLFRRSEALLPALPLAFPPAIASQRKGPKMEPKMTEPAANLATLADHVLLQQFSPPAVLVNEAGDIVYISGRTGKYLEPAAGKANWNLFAMAREGLSMDLASALHRAARQEEPVVTRDLKVGTNGGTQVVTLTVQKLLAPSPLRGLIMVVFRDQPAAPAGSRRGRPAAGNARVAELEQELAHNREELRGLQQEMQTSQEELKSTNEELQSTNEELQSTNEELTTSKEELQSLNEELQTINAEQLARMEDLARTSSDMKNLLDATDIATVFLDGNLKVARFTAGASNLYKLLPGDVGRPLTDITASVVYPDLPADAREVLRTLIPREKSVAAQDGSWYWVRIMPYRTPEDRIDGLVITFTDTTVATRLETQLRSTAGQFQSLLERLAAGYVLCDLVLGEGGRAVDGRVVSANRAFERLLGPRAKSPVGRTLAEALPAAGPIWAPFLAQLLASGGSCTFDQYFTVGGAVLEISGYRPAPDQFVCIFRDTAKPGRFLDASE